MKNNQHTPYTYLIGWTKHNTWYYGVRYAKDCHPSDLFVSYFTSSDYVKKFIEMNGNPDIIQVRKTFNTPKQAKLWESKVLPKLYPFKDHWLNKRFDSITFVPTTQSVQANIHSKKNRTEEYDKIVRQNISQGSKKGHENRSEETKSRISLQVSEQNKNRDPSINEKISKSVSEIMKSRSQKDWDNIKSKKQETWKKRKQMGIKKKISTSKCPHCFNEISKSNFSRHEPKCYSKSLDNPPLS